MAVSMLDNLSIKKKAPNVDRDLFATLAEMSAYSENYLPDVFECNVVEDGKRYRFNRNNPIIPTYGKWREVAGNELQDMEQVTKNKEDIAIIKGDSTVEGSMDAKVTATLNEAKLYTDEQIAKMSTAEAIVCDTKPSRADGVTSYTKEGNPFTTEDSEIWFYYEEDGKLFQTIWIDEVETTIVSAGSVNFEDYVSKTYDVVEEFTGDEADVDKIPNLQALKNLEARIQGKLDKKVTGNPIVDDLMSEDSEAPLSANQGRVLNESIGKKMDAKIIGEDIGNKILGTDNEGNVIVKSLDNSIDASSENTVKNKVIAEALDGKVSVRQDPSMRGRVLAINDAGECVFVSMASAGGNSAELVGYTNAVAPEVDNVQAMLDKLSDTVLYKGVSITEMTLVGGSTINEYGAEYNSGSLSIVICTNKSPDELQSMTITDSQVGVVALEINNNIKYDVADVTNSKRTFVVSATDGKSTATKSVVVDFGYYMRWGVAEILPSDEAGRISFISNLTDKKLTMDVSDTSGNYSFNAGSGQYAYFAVYEPHSSKAGVVKINGFDTDLELEGVINMPSEANPSITYPVKIYRTGRSGLGQFTAIIS